MKKRRNYFNKLLSNCKMNAIYQKEDGTWTINSSTNKRRMEKTGSSVGGAAGPNSKQWTPSKLLITAEELEKVWHDQGKVCYWFKIPLDFDLLYKDHPDWCVKHPLAPSVDKIDDEGDYEKGNVVISCRFANFGRNVYPFDKMNTLVDTLSRARMKHVQSPVWNMQGNGLTN